MLLGEVQIDGGLFQVAMSEQDLNGAEVSPSLEQVRRKAVAQSVGMDMLMLKTSAECGLLTSCPEHLGRYSMARRMPPVAGKQPERRLVPEPAPGAQRFK